LSGRKRARLTNGGMASHPVVFYPPNGWGVLPYHSRRLKMVESQPKSGDCTSSTSPTIEGSGKPAKVSKKSKKS